MRECSDITEVNLCQHCAFVICYLWFSGFIPRSSQRKKKLYIVLCLHDCCLCDCKITFYSIALNKTWGRVHRKIDAATKAWDMRGTSLQNFVWHADEYATWVKASNERFQKALHERFSSHMLYKAYEKTEQKGGADNVQCAVYLLQYVCLNYCGMNFYQKYKSYVSVVHEEIWTGLVGIYCDSHCLLVHFCIHKELTSSSFIYFIL